MTFISEVRRILDAILFKREVQAFLVEAVSTQWDKAGAHAKEAVSNFDEIGLTRRIVGKYLLHVAQLVAVGVESYCVGKFFD